MSKQVSISLASEWLKVPESIIRRWITRGVIPFSLVQGRYMIEKTTLESWAASKRISLNKTAENEKDPEKEYLIPAMEAGDCFCIRGISSLMDIFLEIERLIDLKGKQQVPLSQLLYMRERVSPTALGRGVAVPQPRFPLEDITFHKPIVYTFFLEPPVDFNALDGVPVFVLFVLLCSNTSHHLEVLSQLANIVRDNETYQFLKSNPNKYELVQKFKKIYRGSFQ
ncbi:PTS sugar transporter subunit IIA [Deltaproteobacteria bacterium TL4]